MILYGCAAQPIALDGDGARGYIVAKDGRPGLVVAAPHGTSDVRTGDIAAEIARRTRFGLVVATGFMLEEDTRERPGRRYQVNRPREGVPGRPRIEESDTDSARSVYDAYERRVVEAAQGPLHFYVEIHGNNRRASAGRIEVATVGVDHGEALTLRTLLERVRDAHLEGQTNAPRLEVLVEPCDTLIYCASGAKRDGILRLPDRALHIELPKTARIEWSPMYTAILAEFLEQAATLPRPN